MRPDKIIFMQTFPTGEYRNQKLGMEILLDDGDSPKAAFQLAKELVNEAFSELNPIDDEVLRKTFANIGFVEPPPNAPPVRNLQWERDMIAVETAIERATGPDALAKLYEDAKKYDLTQQYNNKLKSLQ